MNAVERQLELLHGFLAEHPCSAGTRVSDHVQREAAAGNVAAQRVLRSGLFNGGGSDVEAPQGPAPIVPPAVLERERRIATQRVPTGKDLHEPARPIVHSGETRAWLK